MKKKIYLTLAIFILLIILIIVFIIFPLFNRIKKDSKELVNQKENYIYLESKIDNLQTFVGLEEDIEYFLEEVDGLFVDSRVPIEFIDFLERNSEESDIEIDLKLISEKKTDESIWPNIVFQITSTGSLANFLRFLEKLENNPYLIEIENININRLAQDREALEKEVRASFLVKVFVK